jgi:DNA polymerase-1
MVRCHRAFTESGLETRLILQIHDELLFEGPEAEMERAEEIAVREMRNAFELDPPLEVNSGSGPDWLSVK